MDVATLLGMVVSYAEPAANMMAPLSHIIVAVDSYVAVGFTRTSSAIGVLVVNQMGVLMDPILVA